MQARPLRERVSLVCILGLEYETLIVSAYILRFVTVCKKQNKRICSIKDPMKTGHILKIICCFVTSMLFVMTIQNFTKHL